MQPRYHSKCYWIIGIIIVFGIIIFINGCVQQINSSDAIKFSEKYMKEEGHDLDYYETPEVSYIKTDNFWVVEYKLKSDSPWPTYCYVRINPDGKLRNPIECIGLE